MDVLCKRICAVIDPGASRDNINDYRKVITQRYPKLHSIEVLVPRFELVCHPWAKWSGECNPNWWVSYNRVKHQRDDFYREASLHNALESVAGLFTIVLYLHRAESIQDRPYPYPQLLDLERSPGSLLLRDTHGLPDFL